MAPTDTITAKTTVDAAPDEVYRYFTMATLLREWFCDVASTRPVEGGRLFLGWEHGYGVVGNFTDTLPGKKVGFTWLGTMDPGFSEVAVSLEAAGKGTAVTVTHTCPGGKAWDQFRTEMQRTWDRSLENLASVMATGHDLRFTRRPMMGVLVDGEIDAARAAKLGLPVNHGVALGGTAEGMGARAAGLAGGDVVVRIADHPITGFASFAVALQPHRAGDTVEVVYYRDGKEHKVPMTLSGRPIGDVPMTAAALAAHVRELFDWVETEVTAAFAGASEADASARPGPNEWSGKEVLSHLHDGEGDTHGFIAELIQGVERTADGPLDNSHLRIRVTADSYPTVAEMLAGFRKLNAQTVALLAGLPDQFVARKGSFWRLAYGYTQGRDHYQEHFDQIKAAIAAAQKK